MILFNITPDMREAKSIINNNLRATHVLFNYWITRMTEAYQKEGKEFFSTGTKGFHKKTGKTAEEGLKLSKIYRTKSSTRRSLYARIANLYENFKRRRKVKLLSIIKRKVVASGIENRIKADYEAKIK